MHVAYSTLRKWRDEEETISAALKKGKEVADYEVESALFKRATGFRIKRNVQKVTKDGDVVDTEEEVYYPPETTAMIFWLKNRKPEVWREKQDKNNDNNDKVEELLQRLEKEAKL